MWATRWRCPHFHRPGAAPAIVACGARTMGGQSLLVSGQARRRPQQPSLVSAPCPTPCRARMRGQYLTRCRLRPRPEREGADGTPARFFLCVRCRAQVLICSCCDRGQIYCADGCAGLARRERQRAAGQRYQTSHRGRLAHALRARRYRARQKNVTHQGSLPPPPDDLLSLGSAVTAGKSPSPSPDVFPRRSAWHCHWCGCRCPQFVRHGFLRRRWVPRSVTPTSPRTTDHDHPP